MKKQSLLSLALILGATMAHATPWVQTKGTEVCANLQSGSAMSQCLSIVRSAKINPWAAAACNSITESSEALTLRCLETVAGHEYHATAARVCDKMQSKAYTIACLKETADKRYKKADLDYADAKANDLYTLSAIKELPSVALVGEDDEQPAKPAPIESSPYKWDYYDGKDRVANAREGFIQLSSEPNYCGGRVKLSSLSYTTYRLTIEGSWCKSVRFGFIKQGDRLVKTENAKTFNLSKSDGSDGSWKGYGIKIDISLADLLAYSNNEYRVNNQISFVLMTDSRDDSHKPAYEKLSINLN